MIWQDLDSRSPLSEGNLFLQPLFLALFALALILASEATVQAAQEKPQVQSADDGQWTMPARDYASTRYAGLSQINSRNARSLRPLWTFSTGVLGGHEGQPLVVKDTCSCDRAFSSLTTTRAPISV